MIVNCVIHGGCKEAGTSFSFVAPQTLTLSQLENIFPFEGDYHFRAKVSTKELNNGAGITNGSSGDSAAWLDLTKDSDIPKDKKVLELQALIINLPPLDPEHDQDVVSSEEFEDYLDELNSKTGLIIDTDGDARPRRYRIVAPHQAMEPPSSASSSSSSSSSSSTLLRNLGIPHVVQKTVKSATTSGIKSVAAGATSLWGLARATASQLQKKLGVKSLLSDESEENLSRLSSDVETAFDDKSPEHLELLRTLWDGLIAPTLSKDGGVAEAYARHSIKWKDAGFQKEDPTTDLKASGILAIRAMIFFTEKYASKTREMVERNKANIRTNYPFAIVAINITLLLAEYMNLRDLKYLSVEAGYWEMFEDPTAFFEFFCVCFFHMDYIWQDRKAVRSDFGKLIGEIKTLVSQVLERAPKSVEEFKWIAADEGMVLRST